ncbi:hypothetical protein D6C99_07276 [Aureobasidium pullulans]|nr:hypothetical protein D6C99_07276 [Aureobasidium pullulans]
MPCRLQPYIWISDDALTTAYRRFANACPANHSQNHTRRHGSSVPGPLEARRRLARRRMAGLTMASPSPGLMPDFGALFGSGGTDMTSLWSPPNTDKSRAPIPPPYHTPPPAPPSPPSPHVSRTRSKAQNRYSPQSRTPPQPKVHNRERSLEEYRTILGSCDNLESLRRVHARLHSNSSVSVDFSKAALLSLLQHASPDQVLDFLQSDLDHEYACNMHMCIRSYFIRKSRPEVLRGCFSLLCDKIALGTVQSKELLNILLDMPTEAEGADGQLLLDAFDMLHRTLVDTYSPKGPPTTLTSKLLKNILSLRPSADVLKLVSALLPLAGHESIQVMARYLEKAIISRTMQLGSSDQLSLILCAIPSQHFDRVIFFATKRLIITLDTPEPGAHDGCAKRLLCWLEDLSRFDISIFEPSSTCASLLYPFLASRFTVNELGAHFRYLHPADTATIVLHNWIKPSILEVPEPDMQEDMGDEVEIVRFRPHQQPPRVHSRHSRKLQDVFSTYGLDYTISRSPEQSMTHKAALAERQEVFDRVASTLDERCRQGPDGAYPTRGGAWVHLFVLLSQNKIEYAGWLHELFQVLKAHKSPTWTYFFFAKLTKHNVNIPYPVAVDLMRFFIDIRKPQWALDVFNRPRARQWISDIPELLLTLIDTYPVRSEFIFDVLNRSEYSNSLPKNLRWVLQNPLSEEMVQLVHQAAYAMAKSPLLSSRMALRRVEDCRNYLEDRKAPLSSLMSRALVYAGVTRPLREGVWLSTEKFKNILSVVRNLEGDEVADRLDEAAFTLRHENFESNGTSMKPFDELEQMADQDVWRYRKQFGHKSHRWKKVAVPCRPAAPKKRRVRGRK